ncbi:tyrosine-type recombinase/integrase [Clostridium amazonitimonense]|uniref:tyrosine-type recombinase/integrase n=1 Tax=Clostridium amazonitimonense TaxID=1499689 RepID=UPI0005093ECA|nr:site-specific integrase [Clostridium amazonitimonense]
MKLKKGITKGKRVFNAVTESKSYNELFEEYYKSCKIQGKAEATLKTYIHHHNYFLKFVGEEAQCHEITKERVEEYVLYLQGQNLCPVSVNSYLRNISPILKYGMKKELIEDFKIPVVVEQETFKEIYSPEELTRLLKRPSKKDFVTYRTWAMIWVFATTGIRAKELEQLRVKSVNLVDRVISTVHTKNKKARYLPISTELFEVLTIWLKMREGEGEDFLFCSVYGEVLARSTMQKAMSNYFKERKVYKTPSFHLFRHTFITNAVNRNVNPLILKRITGHSSNKQLNRYYNACMSDIVEVIDDIAPRIGIGRKKEF